MGGRVGRDGVDPGKRSLLLLILLVAASFSSSIHPHISIRLQKSLLGRICLPRQPTQDELLHLAEQSAEVVPQSNDVDARGPDARDVNVGSREPFRVDERGVYRAAVLFGEGGVGGQPSGSSGVSAGTHMTCGFEDVKVGV